MAKTLFGYNQNLEVLNSKQMNQNLSFKRIIMPIKLFLFEKYSAFLISSKETKKQKLRSMEEFH